MVFDVDKLKEALGEWDRLSEGKDARLAYPLLEIVTAARLVVAGQPLWWCEEHKASQFNDAFVDGSPRRCLAYWRDNSTTCRMVEWWRVPTGKDET